MPRGFSRALRRGGVLALVVGGAALVMPSLALANPACGRVVTSNVTLTANMNCTSGNDNQDAALFVGKRRITINLNGFSITSSDRSVAYGIDNTGDWTATAPGSGGTSGPGTGFNRVTVKNGNINGFYDDGIYAEDLGTFTVANVNSNNNGEYGLALYNSNKSSVTASHFNYNGYEGVDMGGNAAMTLSDSTANNNGNYGVYDDSSQATLNGVKANHNSLFVRAALMASAGAGVYVDAPVAPYLVENSRANGNRGTGFETENNHFVTIMFTGNNSENNGGWGYFAEVFAKGSNNGYENDGSGGCHNVGGCHLNP